MNTAIVIEPEREAKHTNVSLFFVLMLTMLLLTASAIIAADAAGKLDSKQAVPKALDLNRVKIRIVDLAFVKELTGINATYKEQHPDKYRAAIVTLEVNKPAGETISIQAQDLTLHYSYGGNADVSGCAGLSSFSTGKDVDRPMNLWSAGYGFVATGTTTRKSETVFIDAFFLNIEPDVSKVYLLVAQPIGASCETKGWQ